VQAINNDLKPRDIITRKSIENAIALVMATGGSTNAVLHYLAIASAAEVPWTIDDYERIRQKVPVLCDLKPSGKYVAVDFHRAGGVPQVLKMLLKAGLLHGECMTITGRTMAQELEGVPDAPRADQDVIRPIDKPLYAQGHLAILRGNLSPEGCVAKITGLKNPAITGPARVFNSENEVMDAIMALESAGLVKYSAPFRCHPSNHAIFLADGPVFHVVKRSPPRVGRGSISGNRPLIIFWVQPVVKVLKGDRPIG